MSLIIPNGFGQVAFQIENPGDPKPWYVTLGVGLGDSEGDYAEIADVCASAFSLNIATRLATDTRFSQTDLYVGTGTADTLKFTTTVGATNGSINEAMLPQNCAALVDKVTSLAGRRGRGRMFIPNIVIEGQCDSVGRLVPAFRTTLQEALDGFQEYLEDGTTGPQVLPFVLHAQGISMIPPPTQITSFVVQSTIATQRRRLR